MIEGLITKKEIDRGISKSGQSYVRYVFTIDDATSATFTASASRSNSNAWSGQIEIDEYGKITGQIENNGYSITPYTRE